MSASANQAPVLVVGGGIGGLSAALARKGVPVQVLEQAPEFKEIGALDMSWRYGQQPELPHVDNVPMPPPTRLAS